MNLHLSVRWFGSALNWLLPVCSRSWRNIGHGDVASCACDAVRTAKVKIADAIAPKAAITPIRTFPKDRFIRLEITPADPLFTRLAEATAASDSR